MRQVKKVFAIAIAVVGMILSSSPAFAELIALQFDCSDNQGVASGALGPGNADTGGVGVISGGTWNALTGHFSGTAKDQNGADVSNITVQFGSSDGSGPIANWDATTVSEWGSSGNTGPGVHDTPLTKDIAHSQYRRLEGMRISGLPAGTYDVFFMPRFGTILYAMDIDIGVNINALTTNSSFTSPALTEACSTWVEGTALQGGNYFRKEVTISGPSDYIVMLDDVGSGNANNLIGFQVAQIPEPTSLVLLLSGGSVMLVLLRRRLRKARI